VEFLSSNNKERNFESTPREVKDVIDSPKKELTIVSKLINFESVPIKDETKINLAKEDIIPLNTKPEIIVNNKNDDSINSSNID
jgi:hypothetical protein